MSIAKERVIVYIDGFSLYNGLKSMGWKYYYWLDLRKLCENLIDQYKTLVDIRYFTSHVRNNDLKEKRQSTFLTAQEIINGIIPIYGFYNLVRDECEKCKNIKIFPKEKATDTNITIKMLIDAVDNKFDTAFLITGDEDFVPLIEAIRAKPFNKKVATVFPPMRSSDKLRNIANYPLFITKKVLRNSLLPEEILLPNGTKLVRPLSWV